MILPKMSFYVDIQGLSKGCVLIIHRESRTPIFNNTSHPIFRNFCLSKGNFADNNFHKMKRYSKERD